jgi:hypothetical protein
MRDLRFLGRRFWNFGLRTTLELALISLLVALVWYIVEFCKG